MNRCNKVIGRKKKPNLSVCLVQVSPPSPSRRPSPVEDFLSACSWSVSTSRTGNCWRWLTGWSSSSIFPSSGFTIKTSHRRPNQSGTERENARQGRECRCPLVRMRRRENVTTLWLFFFNILGRVWKNHTLSLHDCEKYKPLYHQLDSEGKGLKKKKLMLLWSVSGLR